MEYKPNNISVSPSDNKASDSAKCVETFARKIAQQGDLVRSLKAKNPKAVCFIAKIFFSKNLCTDLLFDFSKPVVYICQKR